MFATNLNHFKSVIAHKFLVDPADRNYFIARFAIISGLQEEFYWNAAQSLEKYLKASIVLNDGSARGIGHNLLKAWREHQKQLKDFALTKLDRPDMLNKDLWSEVELDKFLERLDQLGNPSTRYGLVSTYQFQADLFMYDKLVFELRRRTIGAQWIVGKDWDQENLSECYGMTYADALTSQPTVQIRKLIEVDKADSLVFKNSDYFFRWNLSFARAECDLEDGIPPTVASPLPNFRNSYLYILHRQLSKTKLNDSVVEKVQWLLRSFQLSKDVENEFRRLIGH